MFLLFLGILFLGGYRGCLLFLLGYFIFKELKIRKVLINLVVKRWKRIVEIEVLFFLGRRRIISGFLDLFF